MKVTVFLTLIFTSKNTESHCLHICDAVFGANRGKNAGNKDINSFASVSIMVFTSPVST